MRMTAPAGVAMHRDFVFARINPGGPDFAGYFGEALAAIDNLVDRSPVGRIRIEGGCLRTLIRCNWKTYLENINDTVQPLSTHEAASGAAGQLCILRRAARAAGGERSGRPVLAL